jgi:hypothetical protein
MLTLVFLVFFLVLEALAAFWQPNPPRVNLIAAGLAFLALALIFGSAGVHPLLR